MTRLLTVAAALYAAGMVVLALLWFFGPTHTKWLTLSNMFAPFLFAPLLPLLLLALFVRSLRLRISTLVVLSLFLALFGARFMPHRASTAAGTTELRVVTFNQLYTNERVDAVLDTLLVQNADLIAVQELSPAVANALRVRLGDTYPYMDFRASEGTQGVGLFSRYPLTSVTYHWYPQVQRATVAVGGTDVTVLNVHPPAPFSREEGTGFGYTAYDPRQREPEFLRLLTLIDKTPGPRVVLGDFNLSDREPLYKEVRARLTDVYRTTAWGFGLTYPNYLRVRGVPVPPLIRIDYVWTGGGVVPLASKVVCDGGSDHCMVVANLGVPAGVGVSEAETNIDKDAAEVPTESATGSPAENPFTITVNFTASPTPGVTGGATVGTP